MRVHYTIVVTPCLLDRFWAKVCRKGADDCWPWLGRCGDSGYGVFDVKLPDGRWRYGYAHRVALTIAEGPLAADAEACHRCDERYAAGDVTYRRCCNPAHLFAGTQQQNIADMDAKGRRVAPPILAAERNGRAVLTWSDVALVRAVCEREGMTAIPMLAARYGVTKQNIRHIALGHTWKTR